MAGHRGRRRGTRGRLWGAMTSGDRPYALILVVLVTLAAAMALGPLQVFSAAADRVDELEGERERLEGEVEGLEERRDRLEDPSEIERLARSELGLVRPGEIPFVVVVPEEGEGETPDEGDEDEADDLPWYRHLGRWLGERLDGDE